MGFKTTTLTFNYSWYSFVILFGKKNETWNKTTLNL